MWELSVLNNGATNQANSIHSCPYVHLPPVCLPPANTTWHPQLVSTPLAPTSRQPHRVSCSGFATAHTERPCDHQTTKLDTQALLGKKHSGWWLLVVVAGARQRGTIVPLHQPWYPTTTTCVSCTHRTATFLPHNSATLHHRQFRVGG